MSSRIRKLLGLFVFYFRGGVSCARYHGVKVGNNSRIYIKDFGTEPFLISIGNNVTVTSGVVFLTHDGSMSLIRDEEGRRYKFGRIDIGDNVFIGVNSIILPGVCIASNAIVAAGSVVSRSIDEPGVYAGVPARKVSDFQSWFEKYNEYPSDRMIRDYAAGTDLSYRRKVDFIMKNQPNV